MRATEFPRRSFPILGGVAGLLLVADLVAAGEVRRPLRLAGIIATSWTHCLAAIHLESTGRRVEELALSAGLPEWVREQSRKNWRKASLYWWPGLPTFPMVAFAEEKGLIGGAWSVGLLAANLAFQVGAFVGEFAILAAQARLLGDVEAWSEGPGASPANAEV